MADFSGIRLARRTRVVMVAALVLASLASLAKTACPGPNVSAKTAGLPLVALVNWICTPIPACFAARACPWRRRPSAWAADA